MEKNLYIDASHPNETRIVLKSNNSIEEYEFEDKNNLNFKNNIYLATISRVEPSLQAAFVNFGRERHGFLAFNDIQSDYYQIPSEDKDKLKIAEEKIREDLKDNVTEAVQDIASTELASNDIVDKAEDKTKEDNIDELKDNNKKNYREKVKSSFGIKRYKIQEVIKPGQVILIQVIKEERGQKGAALTTFISLAGKYIVLMPNTAKGGGISRKIFNSSDRHKIRNILNDNYTYFYVKKADASRIYGLELEHMLSPYNLNFLVYNDTLIEEHIAGIPGDEFIKHNLPKCNSSEKAQIAKEFVKFNERCMIRLLGDMRSYNYVVVPTHDFDHVVYKIRAIDFDQQSYEGKFNVYRPQFFKENFIVVDLVANKFRKESINQYKLEERSIVAKRLLSYENRIEKLLNCMILDTLSSSEHVNLLKAKIFEYTKDKRFKNSKNMGEILKNSLDFVKRNYQTENTSIVF